MSERQLIESLVNHDNVLDLAKNIAFTGFFPSEPLVVTKEKGKTIVLEGNRRLAACKLLLDPSLAPAALEKRFRAVAGTAGGNLPSEIPVIFAPSREAAYPLIIARHTSSQIEKWQPAMQARFYHSLVQSGLSIQDIADRFKVPPGEVTKELRGHQLYQMACRLNVPGSEAIRDPRKFPLSTLMRVFDAPQARDFFGLKYGEEGQVEGTVPEAEFARGYGRLVSDIVKKRVDSRSLNSPTAIKTYLEGYAADEKPDTAKSGTFTSDSFMATAANSENPGGPAPKKKPKITPPVGLIPRSFPCQCANTRVQDLVAELKQLSPIRFPNACAFAFRCLIEISAYVFLEGKGQIVMMKSEYEADVVKRNAKRPRDRQQPLEPNWSPTLDAMLRRISDAKHSLLSNPQTRKALPKVMNDDDALFALNLSVHNPSYHPSEQLLRTTWKNLEGYFREVLA